MDVVFVLALALEAIPIGLITVADRPNGRSQRAGRIRGFNCCAECDRPLEVDPDARWRLAGTCARCGQDQEWAAAGGAADAIRPAVPVEPWEPLPPVRQPVRLVTRTARPEPAPRSAPAARAGSRPVTWVPAPQRGIPSGAVPLRPVPNIGVAARDNARGVPAPALPGRSPARRLTPRRVAGAPVSPSPVRPVPAAPAAAVAKGGIQNGPAQAPKATPPMPAPRVRPPRQVPLADPFVRAAAPAPQPSETPPQQEVLQDPRVHRSRPERVRGFRERRRDGGRASEPGQKGFNCCEECGEPLPRDADRAWRYVGTCPRCGHVQIWAD